MKAQNVITSCRVALAGALKSGQGGEGGGEYIALFLANVMLQ